MTTITITQHGICTCPCHMDECDTRCNTRYRNEGYCIVCEARAEQQDDCDCGCARKQCWGCGKRNQALSPCELCVQCEDIAMCEPDDDD